jgi:hypothetical protein
MFSLPPVDVSRDRGWQQAEADMEQIEFALARPDFMQAADEMLRAVVAANVAWQAGRRGCRSKWYRRGLGSGTRRDAAASRQRARSRRRLA